MENLLPYPAACPVPPCHAKVLAALLALAAFGADAATTTPIHSIQGPGNSSPLVGQSVTTSGVVTGRKSNGFFIQAPDSDADSDPNTSEGLFVSTTASLPAAAVVGNLVNVQGTVSEFVPSTDPNSLSLTQLVSPTITLVSTGNALPAPVVLTASKPSPTGSINQLEPYEGMRVSVASLDTISPTEGGVTEARATATSSGVFYGVVTGLPRPFREPGIDLLDLPTSGAPANTPHFDANPERLRIETAALQGSTALDVTSGVTLSNLVGPLDYRSRTYAIDTETTPVRVTANSAAVPVRAATAREFTVVSFNLGRFFDAVNDSNGATTLTAAAFNNRLKKASLTIRNVLLSPDIIAVQEIENLSALGKIADQVNADAIAAGQPDPVYIPFVIEGNDNNGLNNGFLVKTTRITLESVAQLGKSLTYIKPTTNQPNFVFQRPPLILNVAVNLPGYSPFDVGILVSQLRSFDNLGNVLLIDDFIQRKLQAEFLANAIQAEQTANPSRLIIPVGDYNAPQFNDGYVDVMGTVKGIPTPANQVVLSSPDLVNPDLTNLVELLPAAQRYSLLDNGNAQAFQHVLVSNNQPSQVLVAGLEYGRVNADFPEIFRNDVTRPERTSTQDPVVGYFSLDVPPVCSAARPVASAVRPIDHRLRSVGIAGVTDADNDPVQVTVTGICQDEDPNLEGIPAYAVDGSGIGTGTARVRSEFSGTRRNPSNGRVYHIYFSASDGQPGGACTGEVKLGVPVVAGGAAVDGGALFNSLGPGACVTGR